jgi:hypothetical protein
MPWLYYLIVLAAFMSLQIAVVAARLRRKHFTKINPRWESTTVENLTPEVRGFLAEAVQEFRAQGFEVVANLRSPDAAAESGYIQMLMVDRRTNDLVLASAFQSKAVRSLHLLVVSTFENGTTISTSSTRVWDFYPPDPANEMVTFAWATDPATLCEVHRRRLARAGKSDAVRVAPIVGGETEYVASRWKRTKNWHVRRGYDFVDKQTEVYRLTWKGAFLAIWNGFPWIRRAKIRSRDRHARAIWNELGMAQWEAPFKATKFLPDIETSETSDGGELHYEPRLSDGATDRKLVGNSVTIRIGNPAVGQIILQFSIPIMAIVFYGVIVAMTVYFTNRGILLMDTMAIGGIWVLTTIVVVLQLTKNLTRAGRVTVLTASPAALSYSNAPGRKRQGAIPRNEFDALAIAFYRPGLRFARYRLVARLSEGGLVALAIGKKATLEAVRDELWRGLGMAASNNSATPPPLPMPAVPAADHQQT